MGEKEGGGKDFSLLSLFFTDSIHGGTVSLGQKTKGGVLRLKKILSL